ncbi:hypothetical protein GCM10020000_52830 [Streptomyces olivoverticillatus]
METTAMGSSPAAGLAAPSLGRGRGGGVADELAVQERGERVGRRVVEDERGGQAQAAGGAEPVAELHAGERVEAEVLEGQARVDGFGTGVPEDRGGGRTDQVQQVLVPGVGAHRRELRGEFAGARGLLRASGGGAAHRGANQGAQQRRYVLGGAGGGEVEVHGHERGRGEAGGRVVQRQALLAGERGRAGAGHALALGVVQGVGHAAGLQRPQAPGEGLAGQAEGAPVGGEGVEVGVGGRVVGLAGVAEGAGRGGEQHEGGEVRAARQLVQVECGVGLGGRGRGRAARG